LDLPQCGNLRICRPNFLRFADTFLRGGGGRL
jgi:hypothetical protein